MTASGPEASYTLMKILYIQTDRLAEFMSMPSSLFLPQGIHGIRKGGFHCVVTDREEGDHHRDERGVYEGHETDVSSIGKILEPFVREKVGNRDWDDDGNYNKQ